MRIDKLLANMGYGSRHDVKKLLKKGKVFLNGQVIKDPKQHIDPEEDLIYFGEKQIIYKRFVYYMMNKPKNVITATEDATERTVVDLLNSKDQTSGIFPVGRLDKDTEGLLLLTNNGQLAHSLLSPKHHVEKTYYAQIAGTVSIKDIETFKNGVILEDGYRSLPAQLNIIVSGEQSEIDITITEGKFHQIKRMFHAVDKKVIYLKRLRMGSLKLDNALAPGSYRPLTTEEITCLLDKNV